MQLWRTTKRRSAQSEQRRRLNHFLDPSDAICLLDGLREQLLASRTILQRLEIASSDVNQLEVWLQRLKDQLSATERGIEVAKSALEKDRLVLMVLDPAGLQAIETAVASIEEEMASAGQLYQELRLD